ncbi:SMP-30/gluconolactonase/LRE family protein [Novosphingobium sp. MMS21-SN21R]|uniref:SMP-30/gluconolactonase/LRE family protein n=1 Tax=Novosphingobium sp. MMS21-SN21R TaxID=2969298 RepID=UPI0028875B9A|nr:SMP-30/gluconolactonase/LRE family protein [Novosphingobium sp. MMS21-SN21R]MDT0509349.1 SMP-30/gluconolactonase/LRE family protein [Novosphingobium sp. MMS21-SN21R]
MSEETAGTFEELAGGYVFVEAPRGAPDGSQWFSDLLGASVYRRDAQGAVQAMLTGRDWVGGIVMDQSGHVLCSGRGGIVALDPATGTTRSVLAEIDGEPIIAVNDMEGDGRGGLYGGTIDFVSIMERNEAPAPGQFFHMDAHGNVTVLRRDVQASNGIGFSPCGKWLYHSETGCGVWRYPLVGGEAGTPEMFIPLPDSDGMVVDREGGLWVACWESGKLLHYDASGHETDRLTCPYPHIVSLGFEPGDLTSLLVSTGGNTAVTGAGALLRLRVAVPGVPEHPTALVMLENVS